MIKVAINGFGRIGKFAYDQLHNAEGYQIVAINDLSRIYHLKDDSAVILHDKEFTSPLWSELSIDVLIDTTGITTEEKKHKYLDIGIKHTVFVPDKMEPTFIWQSVPIMNEKNYASIGKDSIKKLEKVKKIERGR